MSDLEKAKPKSRPKTYFKLFVGSIHDADGVTRLEGRMNEWVRADSPYIKRTQLAGVGVGEGNRDELAVLVTYEQAESS